MFCNCSTVSRILTWLCNCTWVPCVQILDCHTGTSQSVILDSASQPLLSEAEERLIRLFDLLTRFELIQILELAVILELLDRAEISELLCILGLTPESLLPRT